MEKINSLLNKYVTYVLYLFLILSGFNACNGCSTGKNIDKLKKKSDSLTVEINSLKAKSYSKDELNVRISIEGYEISKRMLYDQNAIVRTTVRPDDRMNEYDQKIKELQEKIK